jgi:hypothetical protein
MHDPRKEAVNTMPYKNLEAKKQWEREHREQRNAKRRRRPLAAQTGVTVSISAPDPRFHKGMPSSIGTASGPEDGSSILKDYMVPLLMVLFAGLVIVITFARANTGTARLQPDPIPANEPKGVLKIAGIGAGIFLVGLIVYAAWAGSFAGNGGNT